MVVLMQHHALELCAGGGGQALGLEMAGFEHAAAVEYEKSFCATLRANRPNWNVLPVDIRSLKAREFTGISLLAAGVPCPPFSAAGKQLGADDERDMFPAALELIKGIKPRAVLFENVRGLASVKFRDYRENLLTTLSRLGYQPEWRVLQASDFGVPQLRPRFVLVALKANDARYFRWPALQPVQQTVGDVLVDLMGANGWRHARAWAKRAAGIAPTIVGGSKKHGGPDLGPTRAKAQWRSMGVDGMGIADNAPDAGFAKDGHPKLTVRMVARIQSFPDTWQFVGKKTIAYRQVGNAFPPLVARAVGVAILSAFRGKLVYEPQEANDQLRLLESGKLIN